MIADLGFIQESFDRFNALCFDGALPRPAFKLGRARCSLGRMEYRPGGWLGLGSSLNGGGLNGGGPGKRRGRSGNAYTLRISRSFDLPRETLEDVVIHEMIHYKLMLDGYRGAASGFFQRRKRLEKPHGPLFRQMMKDINSRFGRHITVSFKISCPQPAGER